MKPILNPTERPLMAKLEAYTDDDPAFLLELIQLMILNLRELQESLGSDTTAFAQAAHKSKSTLTILDDPEVNALVKTLKCAGIKNDAGVTDEADLLFQLIERLIKDLENEATIQKAS
ncbi:MAG TPA: hypothetical protein VFW11_03755 [Cyclobacteriaceae bacterium]|nr:hypothetical protein [Cyclobacteriaceae bacterium]